jgi:hypothetical protein
LKKLRRPLSMVELLILGLMRDYLLKTTCESKFALFKSYL